MKHKIIIILLVLLSLNSLSANVDSDISYLQNIIEQCYVNYNKECENGLNIESTIKKIKRYYKINYLLNWRIKDKKERSSMVLSDSIYLGMKKDFSEKNAHLTVNYKKYKNHVFEIKQNYFTDVYLEKKDEKYIVYKSNSTLLKKGDEYNDDKGYLKKCINDNKELFQIVIQSDKNIQSIKLKFNNKKIKLKCRTLNYSSEDYFLKYSKINKTFYISIKTCPYIFDESKNYINEINNLIEEMNNIQNIENLIIDLRNNQGGFNCFEYLLPQLFCRNYKTITFDSYLSLAKRGEIELISPEYLSEIKKNYKVNFPENENLILSAEREYKENKFEKKYYKGLIDYPLSELPQIPNDRISNKIYILINKKTASQAEMGIALAYLFGIDKVVLIGDSSRGCLENMNILNYTLPNSKVTIRFGNISLKKSTLLICNNKWKGELLGFEPDYWTFSEESVIETLKYLIDDSELDKLKL